MPIKDKPSEERRAELSAMAKRRGKIAEESTVKWSTGIGLILYGIGVNVLSAALGLPVLFGSSQQISSLGMAYPLIVGATSIASIVGGVMIIAGVIRWAIQPLIYYHEQRESRERKEREKEKPLTQSTNRNSFDDKIT